MNEVILKGIIRDIQYSHSINNIEYDQANLVVIRNDGYEDIVPLKFKKFSNKYKDGDLVELVGNLRSHSYKVDDKNKVELYCFTYFDTPETNIDFTDISNSVEIDGRICKIEELRTTKSGKNNLHFILANNIISSSGNQKLNNYIPTVVWGKLAVDCSTLQVSDYVKIKGQLHSRVYKKIYPETNEMVIKIAHELVVKELEKIDA